MERSSCELIKRSALAKKKATQPRDTKNRPPSRNTYRKSGHIAARPKETSGRIAAMPQSMAYKNT